MSGLPILSNHIIITGAFVVIFCLADVFVSRSVCLLVTSNLEIFETILHFS